MVVITKITTQEKNKERYNIFTDEGHGEHYAFSVDEAVLIKFQLKKGMELDEFILSEIHFEDDIRKAYNRALHFLAKRMRSEWEVRTYLGDKEVIPPVIQEVIMKLYDYKFLDDEQYALSFVRTQMNTTDKGPLLIKRELKERGIDVTLIEKTISLYPIEMQMEKGLSICKKVVERNNKDSDLILKQKLEQLLVRKGYSYDIFTEVVSCSLKERNELDEHAIRYQAQKLQKKYANISGYEYELKMKQGLFRKGFSQEQIEDFLDRNDDF